MLERAPKNVARRFVVVDDEYVRLARPLRLLLLGHGLIRLAIWEADGECRAAVRSSAVRGDCSSVQLAQVANDRESEAQSAVNAMGGTVSLPEAVEHAGKHFAADADA